MPDITQTVTVSGSGNKVFVAGGDIHYNDDGHGVPVRIDPPPWFDHSIVQVLGAGGITLGLGVAIDETRVVTRGPVVARALQLGAGELCSAQRGAWIVVRRPWIHDEANVVMVLDSVTEATPGDATGDLALLVRRRGRFVFPVGLPRFVDTARLPAQPVLVRGFSLDAPAEYRIVDRGPNGWFLMVSEDAYGDEIRDGFIGGPAWGFESGGVLGIVSEANTARRTAVVVPSDVLRRFCPVLKLSPPVAGNVAVQTAHPLRRWLDRWLPRVHQAMVDGGLLSESPDREILLQYLERTAASAHYAVESKRRFIELSALDPRGTVPAPARRDPVLSPIQQSIREIVGITHGDGMTAEMSAFSRRSRRVRNIVRRLLAARSPLVLLGEPGSGKSLTLQHTLRIIALQEMRKQFPVACILVRLGEFHPALPMQPEDVWEYVSSRSEVAEIWHLVPGLAAARRLLVMFDGLDEMSRDGYNEYLAELSKFAGQHAHRRGVRTLFSCRVADFSPAFQHQRLLLLPFNQAQVRAYLRGQDGLFPLRVDGREWTAASLAAHLVQAELPVEPSNPFILWMLCQYLRNRRNWPESRVQLLEHTAEIAYEQKHGPDSGVQRALDFALWARLALEITLRNRGSAISLADALVVSGSPESLARGKLCGILIESRDRASAAAEVMLRFDHHRWQEYFAALALTADADPRLRTTGVFDSPRLQETLVNLALLGGHNELFGRLDAFIHAQLERVAALSAGEKLPYDQEALLADRIDFVGRLIAASSRDRVAGMSAMLADGFESVTRFLAGHGRATSQVKVLGAAWKARVPYLDEIAEQVLDSDTRWARNQAVSIVSSAGGSRSPVRTLEVEMTRSLAAGSFLHRVAEFPRIARMSRRRGVWTLTTLGTLFSFAPVAAALVFLFVLRGIAMDVCRFGTAASVAARYEVSQSIATASRIENPGTVRELRQVVLTSAAVHRISVSGLRAYSARWWWRFAGVVLLLGLVAGLMLGSADAVSSTVWPCVLYSGVFMLVAPVLWVGVRNMPPASDSAVAMLLFGGLAWLVLIGTAETIIFCIDLTAIAAFAGVVRVSSGRKVALRPVIRVLGERTDLGFFLFCLRKASDWVREAVCIAKEMRWVFRAAPWAALALLCPRIVLALGSTHFARAVASALAHIYAAVPGVPLLVITVATLLFTLRKPARTLWNASARLLRPTADAPRLIVGLAFSVLLVVAWSALGVSVHDFLLTLPLPRPGLKLSTVAVWVLWALLVVGGLWIISLLAFIASRAVEYLASVMAIWRLPQAMSLSVWQNALREKPNMGHVARLLHWANPWKLGVGNEEFLAALISVEALAPKDPALAAWNQRVNEMEALVKQERNL